VTETTAAPDTEASLARWIASVEGVEPSTVSVERGVVRREAWLARSDRGRRWFVRVGRVGDPANLPEVVSSEAALVELLAAAGLPVPAVPAVDATLGAALYGWVEGSADLSALAPEVQQHVVEQYAEVLGRMHVLDPDALGVDWMPRPATPEDCALAHAEAVWSAMGPMALEPLSRFGMQWLRWHVPHRMERLSVLQGDAGVGNFLVADGNLTGVIDWEWAHLGDPMEDLGSLCMHAAMNPAGHIPSVLAHYERTSGIPVDRALVRYYCAHLFVRSVVALAAITARPDPHNPVALNLCYRVVNDRLACEALADAIGLDLERPELPELPPVVDDLAGAVASGPSRLFDVVAANLTEEIVPRLDSALARNRAEMAVLLVRSLERQHRLGGAVEQVEIDELGELLGRRPASSVAGLVALDGAIEHWARDREADVLRYLYRRAVRTEALYAPIAGLYPDRVIADVG
jgi:aminoglycoside phosphotransferase (APT) family kinase protein